MWSIRRRRTCLPSRRPPTAVWTPSGGRWAGKVRFPQLAALMKVLLVVPAGNASSERVFSQVWKICVLQLRAGTGHFALLSVKWNSDCSQMLRAAKSATANYNLAHSQTHSSWTNTMICANLALLFVCVYTTQCYFPIRVYLFYSHQLFTLK